MQKYSLISNKYNETEIIGLMEYLHKDDEGKEIIEKIKKKYELTKFKIKIKNSTVSIIIRSILIFMLDYL